MNTLVKGFVFALFLFIAGYGSYILFGPDMPIEELCELLLKKFFGIQIEFSP